MRELAIRPYDEADQEPVLALLAASLGKTVDDRYRRFFRWKHLDNPFGRSFMWVGELDGRIVGFRAFLRWRFTDPGGDRIEAVRAVDTATHPDCQGMGIFRTLTLHGLDEMRSDGIAFVFNTPNDRSRPGYLKMGWEVVGRVPVKVRLRAPWSLVRILGARAPAEPWSLPTSVGTPMSDSRELGHGLGPVPSQGMWTDRSAEFVAWRYGGCRDVGSVGLPCGGGTIPVRFRRRGAAVECTIEDVLGAVDPRTAGAVVRRAVRAARADYALATGSTPIPGMLAQARLGPVLTRRLLAGSPPGEVLHLSMGDLELF